MPANKIIKWVTIAVGIGFVISLLAYNAFTPKTTNVHTASDPWNKNMVMGSVDAPNKMVEYTDYFCSFCADLHKAMGDEFKKDYIDTGKLSFETRIVDLLSEVSVNTQTGNEAAFCAADQGKYWEYSHEIITNIDNNFFSKGIGVKNVVNPVEIPKLERDYFIAPAEKVGMNTSEFKTCLDDKRYATEIKNNSEKAIRMGVNGLPNISVNNYSASGFGGGGYDELKLMLKAGGVNR